MSDKFDNCIVELLDSAEPVAPASAAFEAKARETLQSAGIQQARPHRMRWIIAAAVIVLAVIAAMLAPSRHSKLGVDLARAFAEIGTANTLHITGYARIDNQDFDFETWMARDGFYRCEFRQAGELKELWYTDGDLETIKPTYAKPDWEPFNHIEWPKKIYPRILVDSLLAPTWFAGGSSPDVLPHASAVGCIPNQNQNDLLDSLRGRSSKEWPVKLTITDLGIHDNMHEIQAVVEEPAYIESHDDGTWSPGKIIKYRITAMINTTSGKLVAAKEEWQEGGKWQLAYWAKNIEWNAKIASNLRTAPLPASHTYTRDHWWETRLGKCAAKAETEGYDVTINTVERNRNGDVYLTISRVPKSGSEVAKHSSFGSMSFQIKVNDDMGTNYSLIPDNITELAHPGNDAFEALSYFVPAKAQIRMRLQTEQASNAQYLNITLHMAAPCKDGNSWQDAEFRNLPMPSRHAGDDLWKEALEIKTK
jgi:hypothetical protein